MKLHSLGILVAASLKKFLTAADGFHMAALAFPYVERCSPVTVSADSPVLNIFQPVAEAAFSDTLRDPVDGVVIPDQVLFDCSHLDKPGFSSIVDKRCVTSPAVRIAVLKFRR